MGTWTTNNEFRESRRWVYNQRWDRQTLERVWKIWWTPSNAADPYPGDQQLAANLPARPQKRLESAVYGTDPWLKRLVCRSVTVEPLPEAPYTWLVRAQYDTPIFPWNDVVGGSVNGAASDPWGSEYVKQTRTVGSRSFQLYRQGVTPPTNGTQAWPPSADIGGTKVDINGNPQPYHVAQQTLVVEILRDRTAATTTADDPNWATILTTFINKRNSATFLGWGIGYVLCTGITASLDDEVWRISATFVFDEWYHLVQVPVSAPTGQPMLSNGAFIAGEQQRQTVKVVWFQPYPNTADFNQLYLSTVTEQFTKAGPTRV